MVLYNCSKGMAGKEIEMETEIEEMTKADLIAILVSIREVAKANNEQATVNHITKMLEEIRK
mgnify:CR=1 FL=1